MKVSEMLADSFHTAIFNFGSNQIKTLKCFFQTLKFKMGPIKAFDMRTKCNIVSQIFSQIKMIFENVHEVEWSSLVVYLLMLESERSSE
jgi:hypothetical protein